MTGIKTETTNQITELVDFEVIVRIFYFIMLHNFHIVLSEILYLLLLTLFVINGFTQFSCHNPLVNYYTAHNKTAKIGSLVFPQHLYVVFNAAVRKISFPFPA